MNFFEYQARARRQSKWLVLLFALAVGFTLLAVNVVMLVVLGRFESADQGWFSPSFWLYNGHIVFWTSLITVGIISLGSLYRTMQLRDGGTQVARELGGTQVDGTTTDRMHRRLLNVVEEMAIASGVPVPAVFVLEQEEGINAFAAGWSPADAAVAVTRGALESLSRQELQGVIAHEFSHVFNGDMRLNIRLMGVLFGILMLAVIGRKLLRGFRHGGNNKEAGAIVAFGIAVLVIGYIGLFFGRWIQSAVSRQREYLADASAVQFTRSPDGIGGALKKIGALVTGSRMVTSTEEVGHMLFAQSMSASLFATHPPLLRRIQAVDPNFDSSEFVAIGEQLLEDRRVRRFAREQAPGQARSVGQESSEDTELTRKTKGPGGLPLNPDTLIEQIGQPDATQLLLVAALLAELPEPLQRAAHSDDWAVDVLLYLLLSDDAAQRDEQLLMIAEARGGDSEQQVRGLFDLHGKLAVRLRLPLMEQAFPNVRRQPQAELVRLTMLVEQLIDVDGKVDVFEYVLARLLKREIEDALSPTTARTFGNAKLSHHDQAWSSLLAVVAMHGQANDIDAAMAAYTQAANALQSKRAPFTTEQLGDMMQAWPKRLDRAFAELKSLRLQDKQRLIEALLDCIRHDGKIVTVEYELLRLVAGVLRVPLPVIG